MLDQSVQSVPPSPSTSPSTSVLLPTVSSTIVSLRPGSPHVIVEALAGTGKTFTILESCFRMCGIKRSGVIGSEEQEAIWNAIPERYDPSRIYMVAFNRNIANTLKSQVPPGVIASTCHGFGKRLLGFNRIGTGRYAVQKNKTFKILADMQGVTVSALFRKYTSPLLFAIKQIVSLLKVNLIELPSTFEECSSLISELVIIHGMTMPEFKKEQDRKFVLSAAAQVYSKSSEHLATIDYDDMIWLPWKLKLDVRPYEVMFVDERQDLNIAQQELVFRSARRLIMVGDSHQAIYGFAGADVNACTRMESRLESTAQGCIKFPLTYTRRCSKAVVRFNQTIVPEFKYFLENQEGAIFQDKEEMFLPKVSLGDMVVCRTNAPLFSCCLNLLECGIPFRTTIKAFFEETIELIKSFDCANLVELITHLEEWKERKLASCTGARADYSIIIIDQVSAIKAAIARSTSISGLIDLLERVFKSGSSTVDSSSNSDEKIGVSPDWIFLTSIHQAKGLEASRVWWLQHDQVPHPRAKLIQQEINLRWVAGTRAINELVLVTSRPKRRTSTGEIDED